MLSEKKIAANRRNAQRSTGPITPEGRAKVSQNSVTHGLRARRAVLLTEDPREFAQLCDDFFAEWLPLNHTEVDLVEQMCVNKWKLARYEAAETQACMQSSLLHLAFQDPAKYTRSSGAVRYPDTAVKREAEAERSIARANQLIARVERAYFRALNTIARMQDRRLKKFPLQTGYARPTVAESQAATLKVAAAGASAVSSAPKAPATRPMLVPGKTRRFGGAFLNKAGLPVSV